MNVQVFAKYGIDYEDMNCIDKEEKIRPSDVAHTNTENSSIGSQDAAEEISSEDEYGSHTDNDDYSADFEQAMDETN
eukprot:13016368-Ditylum_brightwellii.AAC.1